MQVFRRLPGQGLGPGRGGEGGFIGIEFGVHHVPGLFTGGVRGQGGVLGTEIAAHSSPSVRIRADLAWAVRPSAVAKVATSWATRARASRV